MDRPVLILVALSTVTSISACIGIGERTVGASYTYNPPVTPSAVSHDDAREVHSGIPTAGNRYVGAGVRTAADETPEWWGRGDDASNETNDDPSTLSGPLLLNCNRPAAYSDDNGDDLIGDIRDDVADENDQPVGDSAQ